MRAGSCSNRILRRHLLPPLGSVTLNSIHLWVRRYISLFGSTASMIIFTAALHHVCFINRCARKTARSMLQNNSTLLHKTPSVF